MYITLRFKENQASRGMREYFCMKRIAAKQSCVLELYMKWSISGKSTEVYSDLYQLLVVKYSSGSKVPKQNPFCIIFFSLLHLIYTLIFIYYFV